MPKKFIACLLGAIATMIIGTGWYMALSGPWMAAAGITMAEVDAGAGATPYIASFVAWFIGAIALGALFNQIGDRSWKSVVITGVLVWLSVGMVSTVLSTMYGMRGLNLLWIDGGYTLICVLAILSIRKLVDN